MSKEIFKEIRKREDSLDIIVDKDAWVTKTKIPIHISTAPEADACCITFRTANGPYPLRIKDITDLGY